MKIGPSPDQATPIPKPVSTGAQAPSDATRTVSGTATAAATVAANPPASDASAKLALSSTASNLLTTGIGAEFDAQKVASISAAIDNGSFKINPEAIADKLISNAQELLTQAKA